MQLENLNSEKFETLTRAQLGIITGGEVHEPETTGGGSGKFGGIKGLDPNREYTYTSDCIQFTDEGTILHQEFLIDGIWYAN